MAATASGKGSGKGRGTWAGTPPPSVVLRRAPPPPPPSIGTQNWTRLHRLLESRSPRPPSPAPPPTRERGRRALARQYSPCLSPRCCILPLVEASNLATRRNADDPLPAVTFAMSTTSRATTQSHGAATARDTTSRVSTCGPRRSEAPPRVTAAPCTHSVRVLLLGAPP